MVEEKKAEARLNPESYAIVNLVRGFALPRISHGASRDISQGAKSHSPFSRTSPAGSPAKSGFSLQGPVASAYQDPEDSTYEVEHSDDDYVDDGITSNSET